MIRPTLTFLALTALASTPPAASAQAPVRDAATIASFPVRGIDLSMTAADARAVLLATGFTEGGHPGDWGKVPTTSFTLGEDVTVAITHRDGEIGRIGETRIAHAETFDYAPDVERVRSHFGLADDDEGCDEQPHGTRCAVTDGIRGGVRFVASFTGQMIFLQVRRGG